MYGSDWVTMEKLNRFIQGLETYLQWHNGPTVLTGDFNSKSLELPTSDARGEALSALMASLGLWVCNIGSGPTVKRAINDRRYILPDCERSVSLWMESLDVN